MAEKGRIGVQMMMLKNDVKEKGAYEVFRQLRNMGYTSVEVSQIPMTAENVREMKRGAEDFGIDITACSAPLCPMHAQDTGENLESHYGKIVSETREASARLSRRRKRRRTGFRKKGYRCITITITWTSQRSETRRCSNTSAGIRRRSALNWTSSGSNGAEKIRST